MISQNRYRLNEYQIAELTDGHLWWTSHSGFAVQIGGPCSIWGDILLMEDRSCEENGFMKSEFLDYLKKLPLWNRTRYYCFSSTLIDTSTGRHIDEERLQQLVASRNTAASGSLPSEKNKEFHLDRYQISVSIEGDITWKSYAGICQIAGGAAFIESDILFIGPKRCGTTSEESKKKFLRILRSLPEWNQTAFWSRSITLRQVSTDKKWSGPFMSPLKT